VFAELTENKICIIILVYRIIKGRESVNLKILILTCNTGGGHNSTARSISEKLKENGHECVIADALSFLSPKMSDFICAWHVRIYRYAPVLFGQGYEFAEKHPVFAEDSPAYNFFCLGVKKLTSYVKEEAFEGIISVHVFSALMITELIKKSGMALKTAFVATDYTCSPGVADSNLDAYFIPHENLTGEFVACGVPEEKIIASGIPIKNSFYSFVDKAEAKKQLGIAPDKKHILMMCGSMGCGPMEDLTETFDKILPDNVVLTVVCGTNEKLRKKVDCFARDNIRVMGYTDDVSLLYDATDLYMTKPGGISITEAAVKHLPLAFIDAVSGCESYNRYFFLSRGMALASNDQTRLPEFCIKRIFNEASLEKQRNIMEAEFANNAAQIICDFFNK